MAAGNRGGFNPYRDHAGRFSGPTGGGGGGAQINNAIRAAAGRGGSSSAPTTAEYKAMPADDLGKLSPKSRAAINKAFAQIDPGAYEDNPKYDAVASGTHYGPGINGVASHVLSSLMQRGPGDPTDPSTIARNRDISKAILGAYADAGIRPERGLTPKKMLDIYDSVLPAAEKGGFEQATAHAVVSALSMGDVNTAYTITDGQGAGIGWGLTRTDFREAHGLPDDGRD